MTAQRSSSGHAPTSPSIAAAVPALAGKFLVAATLAAMSVALLWRLQSFPGLHGDEAWVGLRALEQQAKGLFTLRGMNGYTGSLFPEILTSENSMFALGVFSLRLPGAVLNWLALLLMTMALWKRGNAALTFLLLMGSSLLFLFYSRVAWEVNALQNFLLSLVIASLTALLGSDRAPRRAVFLLFLAFSLGSWNHAIFLSAALSFAAAATVVALKWPDEDSARLLLLGYFNLGLQIVLLGRRFVTEGPFALHALPALVAGFALVTLTSLIYVRAEKYLLAATLGIVTRASVVKAGTAVAAFVVAGSLLVSPTSVVAFFGTVSGIIMLERVVSYTPGPIEMVGLHIRMALLAAAFLAIAVRAFSSEVDTGSREENASKQESRAPFRFNRNGKGSSQMRAASPRRQDQLLNLLVMWTVTFVPALMLATRTVADRYYIIPQFLFFGAIALAIDDVLYRWRFPLLAVLAGGFIHAQTSLIREAWRDESRPPFESFAYGSYTDTSRHFLKLDRLSDYLQNHGVCRVESSNFFIAQPMRFLMAIRNACGNPQAVAIDYCSRCGGPVEWFELTQREKR